MLWVLLAQQKGNPKQGFADVLRCFVPGLEEVLKREPPDQDAIKTAQDEIDYLLFGSKGKHNSVAGTFASWKEALGRTTSPVGRMRLNWCLGRILLSTGHRNSGRVLLREASSEVHINDHWRIPTRHTLLLAELEASGGDIDVKEVTRLVDQVKAVLPTSVPQTIRDHADVIIAEASLARISHLDVSRSELESLLRDAESLVTRLLPESSQGLPNHLSNSTDQLLPRVLTIKGESKLRWALAVRRQARVRQGLLAQASEALNQALEILETSGGAPGLYSDGAPLSYWRRPWERSWRRVADMAVFVELELRRGLCHRGQPTQQCSFPGLPAPA